MSGQPWPDDVSRPWARSMRRLRDARGWTSSRLATEAGVSLASACRIDAGITGPSLTTAWRIARALGTTVDAMIAEADLTAVKTASSNTASSNTASSN